MPERTLPARLPQPLQRRGGTAGARWWPAGRGCQETVAGVRVARLRVEEDAGEGLCGGGRRSLAPSGSHAPHPPPNRHAPSWHARLHAVEP